MKLGMTTEEHQKEIIKKLEGRVNELEFDYTDTLTSLHIARQQASDRAKRVRELRDNCDFWRKKATELEKQIEADDVDFIRVIHAREVEKLKVRIDHLEGLCWKLCGENEQLRELVKEMYFDLCTARPSMTVFEEANPYMKKLEQLGFLDGEQND